MKHLTLDCYGASQHSLNNLNSVYEALNMVAYRCNLDPICPPQLIPYYYGRVKEDSGISCYILLKGGHITIHTFPFRECYFVDILSPNDFDEKKIYNFFLDYLPFDVKASNIEIRDRNSDLYDIEPYAPDCDFGPHLMTKILSKEELTMDKMYDYLEHLVAKINMDPITRAVVNKDTIDNPKYISGIIIIAQSHIALHYEIETGIIYADLFSCAPFNYDTVEENIGMLGKIVANVLVPRGTKHIYRVKSKITDEELHASTKWQRVIGFNNNER